MGVNPCERCTIVAMLPQIAKLPKKNHENNGFEICELIQVGILPLFLIKIASCYLEMI